MVNSKLQSSSSAASGGDIVKYVVAALLVVAGIVGFYWFADRWPAMLRALLVVLGLAAAAVVFMTTAKGAQTREFLSESRFELRKVVWPTRDEALRTTWVVIAMVIVISLLLALFDVIIQALIKQLFGG